MKPHFYIIYIDGIYLYMFFYHNILKLLFYQNNHDKNEHFSESLKYGKMRTI